MLEECSGSRYNKCLHTYVHVYIRMPSVSWIKCTAVMDIVMLNEIFCVSCSFASDKDLHGRNVLLLFAPATYVRTYARTC